MRKRSERWSMQTGAYRAQAMAVRQQPITPWWLWAAMAAGVLGAMPARAQGTVVPEREAPTIPPGAGGDQSLSRPRSENPSTPLDGARLIPDRGVVAPPTAGSTPVIRPPTMGTMPVIPPPGSAGGDKSVVPK